MPRLVSLVIVTMGAMVAALVAPITAVASTPAAPRPIYPMARCTTSS